MNEIINSKETMSSLQIAEITGKPHSDVLKAIRKMEPAWEKVSQGKFSLSSYRQAQPNGGYKNVPCYELTKEECLYVATKFNDEARAKLVIRWKQLEEANLKKVQVPVTPAQLILQQAQMLVDIEARQKEQEQRTLAIENKLNKIEEERKVIQQELFDIPLSEEKLPEINERASIRHLVNEYTKLTGLHQQDVWHAIYNDLYYRFSISINSYKKHKGDSNLDVAERNGFLSKIFIIISNMIYNRKKQANA